MTTSPDDQFKAQAKELGFDFSGEIKIGGNYIPLIQHGQEIYVSGQIPRVGDQIIVTGCAAHANNCRRSPTTQRGNG